VRVFSIAKFCIIIHSYQQADFFFNKKKAITEESAYAIMLKVHIDGEGVCGIYSFDVAQQYLNNKLHCRVIII
jgi:hypothetical protein